MRKIILTLLSFSLCACSSYYTSNGEQQYLHSKNGEKIAIPPGLTGENISHFHDLPDQTEDPRVNIDPTTI